MNATEARKRRGGSPLVERTRLNLARAARIDTLVVEASVEQVLQHIMEIENVSAAELGRRIKSKMSLLFIDGADVQILRNARG